MHGAESPDGHASGRLDPDQNLTGEALRTLIAERCGETAISGAEMDARLEPLCAGASALALALALAID